MMKKIEGDLANMVLRETFRPHTLISHCIPSRPMENLRRAQRLIASARRRWHEVQAHWRVTRKPGGFLCEPSSRHIWSERDDSGRSYCQTCEARRVWIVLPNGRGDASIGLVHHPERIVTH